MSRAIAGEPAHAPRPASPFTALARLASTGTLPVPEGPQDRTGGYRPVLRTLLRELALAHAVRYAALWLPAAAPDTSAPEWTAEVMWRSRRWARGGVPDAVADPDLLLGAAGVVATADVTGGGVRYGVLVLAHPEDPRHPLATTALLGETAVCVGLLLRQAGHRAACDAARVRADRAVQRVSATRLELFTVQAVERDRLATAVTATPNRQLKAILERTADLERALLSDSPESTAMAGGIRAALGEMIEQFRSVVRGVYPQVLRSTGVRAALEEVTAALPVPVVFHGELGRRQGWEVESGLYQAGVSAAAALAAGGGEQPVQVELCRCNGVLSIHAQRAGVEPARVAAALRDDARRLAALGGRLWVKRGTRDAATVVEIRLPERLGGEWLESGQTAPEPVRPAPAGPEPTGALPGGALPGGANAAEFESTAGAAARRLLTLLVTGREASADNPPLRVATDRQDGLARVAVVGASAPELVPVLSGPAGNDPAEWDPPAGVPPPICYQYRPYPRMTLDPGRAGAPWRPVRVPNWSSVAWRRAVFGVDRVLVEGPVEALRGLRLLHYRDRTDATLAARLRRWSGTADGPPDAVLLVLSGPPSAAESEFLTVLRAPGEEGFSPVVICAERAGTGGGSQQRLRSMCDALVEWRAAPDGGAEVEAALHTRVRAWAGIIAARWALRALDACLAVGRLDDQFARAVEGAAAGAHQVAELDLLQSLQGGRIRLPRGHEEALRLLGAYGLDARSRLGLAAGAGSVQVTEAAGRELVFWRTQSMAPDAGPAGRSACALLVRACERLVSGGAE